MDKRPYDDIIRRIRGFNDTITETVVDITASHGDTIEVMNTDDQLAHGIDAEGEIISDYKPYRPFTKIIKKSQGRDPDKVTLFNEGDFHRGFHTYPINKRFVAVDSRDKKTEKLVKKYGESIFGLTDENKTELAQEYIKPDLQSRFKNAVLA